MVTPSRPYRLNTFGVTPPGGYRFFEPTTSKWIPAKGSDLNFQDHLRGVQAFYKANHLPIPPNLPEMIQEQLCARIRNDPHWCNNGELPTTQKLAAFRSGWSYTWNDVKSFSKSMLGWLRAGSVSDEEITRRATICRQCPFNAAPPGCTSCAMADFISLLAGIVKPHPMDSVLKACAVCGCSLRAKTRVPLDTLRENMPEDRQANLPDFCWMKAPVT